MEPLMVAAPYLMLTHVTWIEDGCLEIHSAVYNTYSDIQVKLLWVTSQLLPLIIT